MKQTKNTNRYLNAPKAKKSNFGFTLVELIVVITILVILGTIAFVSLGWFSASARDGLRIENLANLHKGLSLFQIQSGTYPMPETPLTISASGTTIGYQGFAKDQVQNIAKLSAGGTQDPSDTSMYTTYLVNTARTKMQVTGFLEDGSTVAFLPEAIASVTSDYTARTPITLGDTIGVLLSTSSGNLNQPLQENISLSFTGIDVVNFTGTLSDGTSVGTIKAIYSDVSSITGTGDILGALVSNYQGTMRVVMPSCSGKWTNIWVAKAWGLNQPRCDGTLSNSGTCQICEAPNNSPVPMWGRIVSTSCTNGWTDVWVVSNGGLNQPTCLDGAACRICEAGAASVIPSGWRMVMAGCPSDWIDIGRIISMGLNQYKCMDGSCRICEKK